MLGLGVFRRKPREFGYKPRFYDPEKEAREQRRKELLGEDSPQHNDEQHADYHPGQYIRKNMYERRGIGVKHKQKGGNVTWKRAVFALIIMFAMLIWILN